jgi:probable phosphoglycerate mutase
MREGLKNTLYLVRHGETDWNAEGRLQGQRDVPLNALGLVQADEAGRRLAALAPDLAALDWVVSPLSRARVTAERARAAAGLEPTRYRTDARLKELSFGQWEGLTWRELRLRDPRAAAARTRDKWGYVPPGGESYAMLTQRVAPVLAELTGDADAVLVSHGGVARAIIAQLKLVPREQAPSIDIWQGRVLVVDGSGYRWA